MTSISCLHLRNYPILQIAKTCFLAIISYQSANVSKIVIKESFNMWPVVSWPIKATWWFV